MLPNDLHMIFNKKMLLEIDSWQTGKINSKIVSIGCINDFLEITIWKDVNYIKNPLVYPLVNEFKIFLDYCIEKVLSGLDKCPLITHYILFSFSYNLHLRPNCKKN